MSLDFFNRKTVIGRKAHQCAQCRQNISAGEQHFYCAGTMDGDFNAYREHTDCEKAWAGLNGLRETRWDDSHPFLADDDGIDDGERDWIHERFPEVARRIWPLRFGSPASLPDPIARAEGGAA